MIEPMVPLEALIEALRGDHERAYLVASWHLEPMDMAEIRRATPGGTMAERLVDKYEEGHDDGFDHGHDVGREEGFSDGHDVGREEGFSDGVKQGRAEGFNAAVEAIRGFAGGQG
jgi:flagellar assembly protein FliH